MRARAQNADLLKREVGFQVSVPFLLRFLLFCREMDWIPVDIDRPVRPGGTRVLARAASDTELRIHIGDSRILVWHHDDCFGRTVLGAGAAIGILGINDTIVPHEHNTSRLADLFFVNGQFLQGAARAYFCTDCAFEIAVRCVEVHGRLEYSAQTILKERWLEYLRWTSTDTDVTGRARLRKMAKTRGTRGRDRMMLLLGNGTLFLWPRDPCRVCRRQWTQHENRRAEEKRPPLAIDDF